MEHGKTVKSKGRFPCSHCDKKCNDKSSLIKHMEQHNDGKQFECEHCGKQYKGEHELKAHIKIYESGKEWISVWWVCVQI